MDPWDRSLYELLAETGSDSSLDLEQLAGASGMPVAILEALERLGILIPEHSGPTPLYHPKDADALRAGKTLLEKGVPLDELLSLAGQMDEAMRPIAAQAVEVFARFVRDSVEFTAASEVEASERLVEAYQTMMTATGELVAGHFRRILLQTARDTLENTFTP
jgi:DNA-binding transcriptional MerR regulator